MEIQEYLSQKRIIQSYIIDFITNDDNTEENYQNLIKSIDDFGIKNDENEVKLFFCLINAISLYHNRTNSFLNKIEQILLIFKHEFNKYFTNSEIFNIFRNNKRILLFLFEEKIIHADNHISFVFSRPKIINKSINYFINDVKPFLLEEDLNRIEEENQKCIENFELNRKNGENESYICELIRKDLIDEFITHINQNDISVNTIIETSIFETNEFGRDVYLIEYAAFFGSIQIFKYLYLNGSKIEQSLSYFAVHGDHPEIINFLEENDFNFDFDNCVYRSIQCFHNDMANYFIDNYGDKIDKRIIYQAGIKYYNYEYFPNDINIITKYFSYFCFSGNFFYVKNILKNKDFNADTEYKHINQINNVISISTPFLYSIYGDFFNITKLLFEHQKINPNNRMISINPLKNEKHDTALQLAINTNNVKIVQFLINCNYFEINSISFIKEYISNTEIKYTEQNSLISALECKNLEIIKLILSHPKLNVNYERCGTLLPLKKISKLPPLFTCFEDIEIFKLLLSHPKINPNACGYYLDENKKERTKSLLQRAIYFRKIDVIQILLSNPKVDVNIKTYTKIYDSTKFELIDVFPLIYALKLQYEDVVELLLKHPCIDVNLQYRIQTNNQGLTYNALSLAIEMGNLNILKLLLNNSSININDKVYKQSKNNFDIYESTVLHLAILKSKFDAIKYLLKTPGINVNLQTFKTKGKNGNILEVLQPILSHVIQTKNIELIKLFLEYEDLDISMKTIKKIIFNDQYDVVEISLLSNAIETNDVEIFKILFDFIIKEKKINEDLNELLKQTNNDQIKAIINEEIKQKK